ncbi:CU044_5270 family protein [Actinoplanes aureus]|uniref:CU044_5270 family protein n=1 Tax=Actinoplanes aureus TaxID=2792083 RepID=A0A931CC26_9ACTN|nr:CU044_5270 family protein [Actinoplanes aureus]MBG0563846.1 CU044_5270 family protein [Actinoplanes aureus]
MTDDLDVALHELYPVPEEDADTLRRVRVRVLANVEEPTVTRRLRPRLSLAAAAVVLTGAVIGVAVLRDSAPQGAMVEVAHTLDAAADAQIRTVDEPVPAGAYRYIATHAMYLSQSPDAAVLAGSRDETWVPADPVGEWYMLRTDTGERTRLLGSDAAIKAAGLDVRSAPERLSGRCGSFYPDQGDLCNADGGWQSPTAKFIAGLPRDPRELYDRLRDDTDGRGQDPDQEVLVYVADALRSGRLPADLRAALYRALTHLPVLKITEQRATLDGRTGTALGVTAAGQQQEIIIDPVTGVFIGERHRFTEDMGGIPAGTVTGYTTVVYGIAAKPWQRPEK